MEPKELQNKRILYSCNDWGYGHLSRSIGIIRTLISQNNELFFAGTPIQQEIMRSYFPQMMGITQDGYDFKFKGSGNWNKELSNNIFKLIRSIKSEEKTLNQLCKEHDIQFIISDHRYGFFHKSIPSIFVTHQLTLPLHGLQKIGQWWHLQQLKKFTSIWVLDTPNNSYCGSLSKLASKKLNIVYIGIQSRFRKENSYIKKIADFILAVISGPIPYSNQLLRDVIIYAETSPHTIKCIVPIELTLPTEHPKNITFYSTNNWKEMDELYYNCTGIISRSGYTTLMDTNTLQKKACLIPTPGQPEQLYLSKLHTNKYPSNLSTLTNDYFISTDIQ